MTKKLKTLKGQHQKEKFDVLAEFVASNESIKRFALADFAAYRKNVNTKFNEIYLLKRSLNVKDDEITLLKLHHE